MGNLLGTIINVGSFIKNQRTEVNITHGQEPISVLELNSNREYTIPDYQREIRWEKENLIELIADLTHSPKFLGNIILDKNNNNKYEVIDGQQRLTALLMTISYIESLYSDRIEVPSVCKLSIDSFREFPRFVENHFGFDGLSETVVNTIKSSDKFKQIKRYQTLWNTFSTMEVFSTVRSAAALLDNIKNSKFNLIVNIEQTGNFSIGYFLDVNLKGIKLDTEDIFKGYLFSEDSSQEIRDEWTQFKANVFVLEDNKVVYPATKIIEHYLYCKLYNDENYTNVKFKENFLLDKEVSLEGEQHYAGEHIILTIRNHTFMLNAFREINKFLEIVIDITNSATPTQSFKALFRREAGLSDNSITVIHNFLFRILRMRNIIPNMYVMKYILEVLMTQEEQQKDDYKKMYGVFLESILFILFQNTKQTSTVAKLVRSNDWYRECVAYCKDILSKEKLPKARVTAQYKLSDFEDETDYIFLCKSLGAIYNYFIINDSKVKVRRGRMNELISFLSDNEQYSTEHFIINNSEKCLFTINGTEENYYYTTSVKKYKNSLFNFIFISRELNSSLGNAIFSTKIEQINSKLDEDPSSITCEYSKMIYEQCSTDFTLVETNINSSSDVSEYYENSFIEEFHDFSLNVLRKVEDRLI